MIFIQKKYQKNRRNLDKKEKVNRKQITRMRDKKIKSIH